jgi:hypothetical protein
MASTSSNACHDPFLLATSTVRSPEHADHQHPDLGVLGEDPAGGFDPVEVRHPDVHDDHLRTQGSGQRDHLGSVGRLTDEPGVGH